MIFFDADPQPIGLFRHFNYGEPLLNSGLWGFAEWLAKHNPRHVELSTNGMPLLDAAKRKSLVENFSKYNSSIIFSIHGSNKEETQRYMTDKYPFEGVVGYMADMQKYKDECGFSCPSIIWKRLFFEWNASEESVIEAQACAKEMGVDLLFEDTPAPSPTKRFLPGSNSLVAQIGYEKERPLRRMCCYSKSADIK